MNKMNLYHQGAAGDVTFDDLDDLIGKVQHEVEGWGKASNGHSDNQLRNIIQLELLKWNLLQRLIYDEVYISHYNTRNLTAIVNSYVRSVKLCSFRSDYLARFAGIPGQYNNNEFISEDDLLAIYSQYRSVFISLTVVPNVGFLSKFADGVIEENVSIAVSSIEDVNNTFADINVKAAEIRKSIEDYETVSVPKLSDKYEKIDSDIVELKREWEKWFEHQRSICFEKFEEYKAIIDGAITAKVIEEPIKIWNDDVPRHETAAKWALIAAAVIGAATVILTPLVGWGALAIAKAILADEAGGLAKLIFASISTLIFLTIGIWATRIAVRYYMTEQHLKNDCRNRSAICHAFVNLQRGNFAKEEDRTIFFQSIMRPSQDGIVQDDGLPQGHPAALLVQLLDPKKASG